MAIYQAEQDGEYLLQAQNERALIVNTAVLSLKTTKSTQGVQVMTLRKNLFLASVRPFSEGMLENAHRFRTRTIPSAGSFPREEDKGEQLTL